nr:MAG TPA: hypothetical protein [Caudoviricetes sp.]
MKKFSLCSLWVHLAVCYTDTIGTRRKADRCRAAPGACSSPASSIFVYLTRWSSPSDTPRAASRFISLHGNMRGFFMLKRERW